MIEKIDKNTLLTSVIGRGLDEIQDVVIHESSDRDEWHKIRSLGFGGSDVGAIMGVNKYRAPIDVYLDKTRGSEEIIGSQYIEWGNILEPIILDKFEKTNRDKYDVYEVPFSIQKGNFVGNLDGLFFDKESKEWGVLEIKTADKDAGRSWIDGVPISYLYQTQHYMYTLGLKRAIVAVLIGGNDYREYRIERDDALIEQIVFTSNIFWNEYVLKETPPPEDGTKNYTKFVLSENEGTNGPKEVVEIKSLETHIMSIESLKETIDDLEKDVEVLKQKIVKSMNRHGLKYARCGDKICKIVERKTKNGLSRYLLIDRYIEK